MTFFEVMTGMAFAAFADAPVDVAVLEVGIGGSWDATNVVEAATCVITPIGLDHVPLLILGIADYIENPQRVILSEVPVVAKAMELGGSCEGPPGVRGPEGVSAFYATYFTFMK